MLLNNHRKPGKVVKQRKVRATTVVYPICASSSVSKELHEMRLARGDGNAAQICVDGLTAVFGI